MIFGVLSGMALFALFAWFDHREKMARIEPASNDGEWIDPFRDLESRVAAIEERVGGVDEAADGMQ